MSSSSSSPCAACKFLRRKCTSTCIFSPYFPPDQPTKFANVHHVFGASNVSKILNDLPASQREDAVNSLAYEAEARIQNPVHGCVAAVYNLQSRIRQIQTELENARKELSAYLGAAAFTPFLSPYVPRFTNYRSVPVNPAQQQIVIKEEQHQPQYDMQQQMAGAMEAEAAAASKHEMMIGTHVGGSGTVHAGPGLGIDDGFGIGSLNELQIQVPPQYMHQNLYGQEHDGAMNDNGTSG